MAEEGILARCDKLNLFGTQLWHRVGFARGKFAAKVNKSSPACLAAYLLDAMDPRTHTIERTHEAVAADLGTSREVVSRLLKDFEQAGLVTLSRGVIRVEAETRLAGKSARP